MLFGALPHTVRICGVDAPIVTDFRVWAEIETTLHEQIYYGTEEGLCKALVQSVERAYRQPPQEATLKELTDGFMWFYRRGKPEVKSVGVKRHSPDFDYRYDGDYIYAAFLDQYGVDLHTAELHWWEFKAMFEGLKADNRIVEIIGYRCMRISPKLSHDMREHYAELKRLYRLPLPPEIQAKQDALVEALKNGGDIRGIMN